jgi:hypothetical protein
MNRFDNFTEQEKRLFAECIWRRQRSYVSGDKQFNDYGKLLNEVLDGLDNYVPGKIL